MKSYLFGLLILIKILNCQDNKDCPEHCICDKNNDCVQCKGNKYYGKLCENECSDINSTCLTCTKENEKCLSCKDNKFYGDQCQNECNFGCNSQTCDIQGRCNQGCLLDYFGTSCDKKCDGCLNTGCDDQGYCKEFKCKDGKHGLKCDQTCHCSHNSNDLECGKFASECLNCKFGYYGKHCQKTCSYKCQTELCCIFKDEGKISSEFTIKTNYKYLKVEFKEKVYKIEIDYNYGFPLTLFNESTTTNCINVNKTLIEDSIETFGLTSTYHFTNYIINGDLYKNSSIKIKDKDFNNIDVIIAKNVDCMNNDNGEKDINGVIGLGFFNSISNVLFPDGTQNKKQNILSYSLKDNNVELLFGTMSSKQIDYIEKLTSCEVYFGEGTDIQGKKMTCTLDGIKSSKHSSALRTKNSYITFSLGEKSKFTLRNDSNYRKYLADEYFDGDAKQIEIDKTIYFLYKKNKINKLRDFGFVFNNFYYSYEPNKFFKTYERDKNYKIFLIGLSNKVEHSEFIIGKEFLEDIKFTISNEEGRIYFYAKNADYSDKFKDSASSNFKLEYGARESAAISLGIIIFVNLAIFSIYFFLRKRKLEI